MPCNFYEILWMFFIYGFIGWCAEVAYVGLNKGHFVNRGFFNGPICPIYGIGVLIVIVTLTPLKKNMLLLFFGAMVLTTILEYLTGVVLEKVFCQKWWDYSNLPFNIQGYVCLKFSIYWGLGCILIMDGIHPIIYKCLKWLPSKVGIFILVILCIYFIADLCVTVNILLKFNKKLRSLEKMADAIHKLSDEIGENIFEKVSVMANKSENIHSEIMEKRLKLETLNTEYKKMLGHKHFGFNRLIKAFPDMKSKKWDELLQKYKKQ